VRWGSDTEPSLVDPRSSNGEKPVVFLARLVGFLNSLMAFGRDGGASGRRRENRSPIQGLRMKKSAMKVETISEFGCGSILAL